MDDDAILAEARRVLARDPRFVAVSSARFEARGDEDGTRPGGWRIVGWVMLQAATTRNWRSRLVVVNGQTGERRIVAGWVPGQPYEMRTVRPDRAADEAKTGVDAPDDWGVE